VVSGKSVPDVDLPQPDATPAVESPEGGGPATGATEQTPENPTQTPQEQ
jgi:hypothetical protein